MTAEEEIKSLQRQIAEAQNARARAQVEHDNAAKVIKDSWEILNTEFNVFDHAQAKELLESLMAQREAAIQEVKNSLAEAGA